MCVLKTLSGVLGVLLGSLGSPLKMKLFFKKKTHCVCWNLVFSLFSSVVSHARLIKASTLGLWNLRIHGRCSLCTGVGVGGGTLMNGDVSSHGSVEEL